MPYTVAKRKLHASLRSYLIKALLLIPKGIIRESNIHLLSAARNIAARMNATELEAAAPLARLAHAGPRPQRLHGSRCKHCCS